jgi:hypothetical protein
MSASQWFIDCIGQIKARGAGGDKGYFWVSVNQDFDGASDVL